MAVIKYIDPETKQPVKIPISGGGGTSVEPNPELSGDEEALNSIKIANKKYKIEGSSSTLSGLDDVELDATPVDKQVLTYDAENKKWVNREVSENIIYDYNRTLRRLTLFNVGRNE